MIKARTYFIITVIIVTSSNGLFGKDLNGTNSGVGFNRDIRPILSDKCFHCHGPAEDSRKAKLRFDIENDQLFERKDGDVPIIARFNATESELYRRITTTDPDDLMPPEETHKTLKASEIALIKQWIDEGATWEDHWVFIAPQKRPVPEHKETNWGVNPIDNFIIAELKKNNLRPSPEADKTTLIRRLSFDLTGLPPSLDTVEDFINNDSPDAYEKVVDQLLDSTAFGEHRARYWLDAARYADTHGMHFDNARTMWPYRDWVVDAFNKNMPFDQFTIEQLAGDLLSEPTQSQLIATGFNRCNVTSSEGGSIDEELFVRYSVDRVVTTSTVWLGLTTGCAVCHTHKFDPISHKEFYQLMAFFNNTTQNARDRNSLDDPPSVRMLTKENQKKLELIEIKIALLEEKLKGLENKYTPDFDEFIKDKAEDPKAWKQFALGIENPWGLRSRFTHKTENETLRDRFDASTYKKAFHPYTDKDFRFVKISDSEQSKIEGEYLFELEHLQDFDFEKAFTILADIKVPIDDKPHRILGNLPYNPPESAKGFSIYIKNRYLDIKIASDWPHKAIHVTSADELGRAGEGGRARVHISYDGSGFAEGIWRVREINRVKFYFNIVQDTLDGSFQSNAPIFTGANMEMGDFRLYDRLMTFIEFHGYVHKHSIHKQKRALLSVGKESHTRQAALHHYFTTKADYKKVLADKLETERQKRVITYSAPSSLITKEKDTPAMAHVLNRGEYDKPLEEVTPDVLEVLPPLPADAPRNRLGLAQWLVAPNHPLTARVTVNRFWQEFFGIGIVKTSEDFGVQGDPPSHPDLLDWLAVDFIENGWDVKALLKQIVMSATYRQDSRIKPEATEIDPYNRLLSRGPRFRLDGEMLRDQALFLSGLLVDKMGGPGVRPYQPDGIWEVGYSASNTSKYFQQRGENLHRRSIYTFWKRTAPPPNMVAFDAPNREKCSVRRERTNTPMQALTLMNDVQYIEAARHLAQNTLQAPSDNDIDRIQSMYRSVLGKRMKAKDQKIIQDSLKQFVDLFTQDRKAAKKLIHVGESNPDKNLDPIELAAWTMVANQILNFDETINKN